MLKQPFICIPGEEQSNHIYLSVDQFYYKLTVSCGQLLKANFSVLPIATTKPLPFSSFFLISAYRCVLQVRSHLKFCWLSCRYELHWGRLSIATMLWRVSLLWPPMLAPTTTNTTFFFLFFLHERLETIGSAVKATLPRRSSSETFIINAPFTHHFAACLTMNGRFVQDKKEVCSCCDVRLCLISFFKVPMCCAVVANYTPSLLLVLLTKVEQQYSIVYQYLSFFT